MVSGTRVKPEQCNTLWSDILLGWSAGLELHSSAGGSGSKESSCAAGDLGSIPGQGRFLREGNGNPLQYSCLEIPWTEEPGGLPSMMSQYLDTIKQVNHQTTASMPSHLKVGESHQKLRSSNLTSMGEMPQWRPVQTGQFQSTCQHISENELTQPRPESLPVNPQFCEELFKIIIMP